MVRTAYLIVGPESSGTRMLTQAFCLLDTFGDYGHSQRLDNLDFSSTPDRIVLRRSLPHGPRWPSLARIITRMQQAGYLVVGVLIVRAKEKTIESQLRRGHAESAKESSDNIDCAVEYAFAEFASLALYPLVVYYDAFVVDETVRCAFFTGLGLGKPQMEFRFNQ